MAARATLRCLIPARMSSMKSRMKTTRPPAIRSRDLPPPLNEQGDLLDVLGNRHTWKQPRMYLRPASNFFAYRASRSGQVFASRTASICTNERCSG